MLSIVPDIHADPDRLFRTLAVVDPGDKIAFLGDLIDAGANTPNPSDRRVLEACRELIESGRAFGIIGNHELNAILFHSEGEQGPLRERNEKNRHQHKSFINSFGIATPEATHWTNWFLKTLPLWRKFEGLRLAHAFWGEEQIHLISARCPDGFLSEGDISEIGEGKSEFAQAVKLLVSGPEVELPVKHWITDNSNHKRKEMRIAWWMDSPLTWKEAALSVSNLDELPEGNVPAEHLFNFRSKGGPVLFGHYKIAGKPRLLNSMAGCLDFPDVPCFYRWFGEKELTPLNLTSV